jgi:hypothetical protein
MKNKLIGILICVMMLVTILPVTALATTTISEPQTTTSGPLDRTYVRGIVLYKGTSDHRNTLNYFAIRLHYTTINIFGEHSTGVIRMEPVAIPSSIHGHIGYMYISGSFWGWFNP